MLFKIKKFKGYGHNALWRLVVMNPTQITSIVDPLDGSAVFKL